jgi:hypothetical protein
MQPAEPWHSYNPTACFGLIRCFTTGRRSFRQRKMRPVVVIVADVLVHQSFQMAVIHNDRVVEQVAAAVATQHSATPFCHGLRKPVRLGWMPTKLFTVSVTYVLRNL